ncbi:dolichol-phosphate mannosyltransferase [Blastocystis sp. subtype 4]|uniref:dolichol-phosphate mannosyltransferase n=1 Tax=Blastocystis sp. subtype 4 TaxID=944170 RepID=UPI00071198BC|nr:dolichol-phosphate mannosyltransferase [Blastocystis sp. subtype 4]KNB43037.1 dolichol-phosphate mannosyltransferase [Blastocystis sp. subtype 4]|eukprot:XP_014526480.1 dolichol-phosphate mannosyltransferase [Blastocystis sp. subtype 4]
MVTFVLLDYAFIYLTSLFGPLQSYLNPVVRKVITWSPVISIVLFGIYAVYTIMSNVIRLKNYPEEAESLLKDVAEAKDGLRKRGYKYELYHIC